MTRDFGFALAMLLVACGGRDTVASKSAAAYREAPEKVVAVHEHAATTTSEPAPMDHSAHAAMQHEAHTQPHATHAAAAPDAHAGHDMASMQQPSMSDHAHHTMPAPAATAPVVPTPPRTNGEIQNANPSSTLQPDAFDAPAPSSVSEAKKGHQ